MTCRCSLSDLLQRSIELIDPPSRKPAYESDGDLTDVLCSPDHASAAAVADDDSHNHQQRFAVANAAATQDHGEEDRPHSSKHRPLSKGSTISLPESTVKKKLRFSKSCLAPKKVPISSVDALGAYELLMHAVSSISLLLPPYKRNSGTNNHFNEKTKDNSIKYIIDISSSWETVNVVADIHRALLVASCLLRELLLPSTQRQDDTSSASPCRRQENDTPTSNDETQYPLHPCTTNLYEQNNEYCPAQQLSNRYYYSDQFILPTLTPSTLKDILATSRRCIHQLQLVEKICAIKTIVEGHTLSQNSSSSSNFASLNEGGDDIHDYDRPISDLHANYDWHDDGFLPLPFFFHRTDRRYIIEDDGDGTCSPQFSQTPIDPTESNILYECCYLPQYTTDPPSSRFEKVAWTRDWIRDERLVSFRMEDYQFCDDEKDCSSWDGVVDDAVDCRGADSEMKINLDEDDGTLDEENVSLDISSAVLVEEESCLIDVMLLGKAPSSNDDGHHRDVSCSSTKKRAGNIKEIRKKKRLKLKQKKVLAAVVIDQNLQSQSIRGKEGFLLLVREETMGGILSHLFAEKVAKTIRVFARLHPSGWLSLEDRSIRCREDAMQLRPLTRRSRYFDLFVSPETTCQPWVRNGATSFQFRCNELLFLGSSSSLLHPSLADEKNPDAHSIENVNLLFGVDEETGGDFVDGFEWVNCVLLHQRNRF